MSAGLFRALSRDHVGTWNVTHVAALLHRPCTAQNRARGEEFCVVCGFVFARENSPYERPKVAHHSSLRPSE